MRTDYNKLKEKLQFVYNGKMEKMPKGKSIETAIEIFKDVKKYEIFNGGDKVDYENELREAKFDLVEIFGMTYEELKGMSRYNIYLTHQSRWVNSIYVMLNEGELK